MEYILLKTKYNQDLSEQLETNIAAVGISLDRVIENGFSNDPDPLHLRVIVGVPCIPGLVAVHNDKLIHSVDNPAMLPTFEAIATQKLAELEA